MAQLPIYRQQGNITTDTPAQIRDLDITSQGAVAMQKTGNALMELSAKWQESKDAVENLDGKNKLNAGISAIINEASNYNDYSTPEDLANKEQELTDRMNNLVPDIVSGFSNNQKAREFQMNGDFTTQQNTFKLQDIFRKKQIDMGRSNLITSQNTNMENFIATGNPAFKEIYLNDLESMRTAGVVDMEYATKMKEDMDKWDVYHVMRQAESDPEGVIQNLKDGAYDIKPQYMNDLLGDLEKIKTNKQLFQELEEIQKQNAGESEATDFVYSNATYDEKLKYINEQEFLGNISSSFAEKARRNLKQFKPEGMDPVSSAQAITTIMERAYDLNVSDMSDADYLKGIRNLREEITQMQADGDISTKDAVKLNKQLANATNKRVSEATQGIAMGYGAAKDYIDKALPPDLQAQAYRDVFYATSDKDTSGMNKTQLNQMYYNAATQAVQKINANNRNQALQVIRPIKKGDVWQGHAITSLYGKRKAPVKGASTNHMGIDLAYRNNEKVNAFAGGKVINVVNNQGKSKKGYGNYVDIQGYDGTIHRYAHANAITVKKGQEVKAGQTIAKAGSTGASSAPHLHYEKIVNGKSVNPFEQQKNTTVASKTQDKGWAF